MDRWYPLVRGTLATAWRWRWLLVASVWAVCLVGWAAVALIPDSYESRARVYVDTDAVLTPLLHGMAVDTAPTSQLSIVQRTLLSEPNLEEVIQATPLNLYATSPESRQKLIADLQAKIAVAHEGGNLFSIRYRNADPKLARDVVAALLNIFMDRVTQTNRAAIANAQKFLDGQIASVGAQLLAIERRQAEFRRKYLDIIPLAGAGGESHLDRARQTVAALETQISDATAKRGVLDTELRTIPRLMRDAGGAGSPESQLAAAEKQLAALRLQYTDLYPAVIAQRRLVEWLKTHAAAPAPAAGTQTVAPVPNPVYTQVQLQILESQATISVLEAQLRKARQDLARMKKLADAAPKVGMEYGHLVRGYDVLHKSYEELLTRRQMSRLTEAADIQGDKVRLRVIDPPDVSDIPVEPPRLLLISAVLVAGLGAAVGLAIVLGTMDRSIWDLGSLGELGQPVLGGISMRPTARQRWTLYPQAAGVTIAVLILIAVYGGLLTTTAATNKVLL